MKSTVMKSTHKELQKTTNRNVLESSKVLYSSEVLVQSYAACIKLIEKGVDPFLLYLGMALECWDFAKLATYSLTRL